MASYNREDGKGERARCQRSHVKDTVPRQGVCRKMGDTSLELDLERAKLGVPEVEVGVERLIRTE